MMPSNGEKVVISGFGCVLPSGLNAEHFWNHACAGTTAVSCFQSSFLRGTLIPHWGSVAPADAEVARETVPYKLRRYCSDATIWGVKAAGSALACSNLDLQSVPEERRGVFTGQGDYRYPSIFSFKDGIKKACDNNNLNVQRFTHEALFRKGAEPFVSIKSLSNNLLAISAMTFKMRGDCGSYIHSDSGGIAALRNAMFSIQHGYSDIALVVCAGSYHDAFTLAEQYSLGHLSRCVDGVRSLRPYDKRRDGTMLGEGAAALVLESERHAKKRNGPRFAELSAMSMHTTALEGEGTHDAYKKCVDELLSASGMELSSIDAICTDGKGLIHHDEYEIKMLEKALMRHAGRIPVTCVKPVIGRIGAAGAIVDIIACLLMLKEQMVPPIANVDDPIATKLRLIIKDPVRTQCRTSMSFVSSTIGFHSAVLLNKAQ